jgi:hypothetical protein
MPKFLSDSYAITGGVVLPLHSIALAAAKQGKKTRTRKMKIFSLSVFLFYYDECIAPGYIASQRVRSSESFWFSSLGQRSLDEIQQRTLLCSLVDGVASGSGV